MATAQPLQTVGVVYHNDALHDLQLWAKQQVLQIEDLSKQQVLFEVQGIMEGHNYSWHCINEFIQARYDEGSLEFTSVDGDVLFEWNNLCDEKRVWEKTGRLSVNNAEFYMDCLINLKILPVQGGLGMEGASAAWSRLECVNKAELHIVTSNIDKPNVSTIDLWVGPKDPESFGLYAHVRRVLTNDGNLSSDSEDIDYVDEEEETDDEGLECKDVVEFDDEDIEGLHMGFDVGKLSGDGSMKEKREDCGDGYDELDELKTEDEDVEIVGRKIVVIDEDEISDFEL